jgi:cell filamentation protein
MSILEPTQAALPVRVELIYFVALVDDPAAHPFREGNGRATREFFNLLLSERGSALDWDKTQITESHSACQPHAPTVTSPD